MSFSFVAVCGKHPVQARELVSGRCEQTDERSGHASEASSAEQAKESAVQANGSAVQSN